MTFQPGANLYTQGFGSKPENIEVPHIESRNPSITDVNYPVGKTWLNNVSEQEYILYRFQVVNGVTQAVWATPVGPSGSIDSLSDNANVKVIADASGNIQLNDLNPFQVVTTSNPSSHQIGFSLSNGISLGSYSSFPPPTGGMLIPGEVCIGTSTPDTTSLLQVENNGSKAYNIHTSGNYSVQDTSTNQITFFDDGTFAPTTNSSVCSSFNSFPIFEANPSASIGLAACFYASPRIIDNTGTILISTGYYSGPGTGGSSTHAYGAFLSTPSLGSSSNTALFSSDLSVGYPNTSPPHNGAIILGDVGIGTSTPESSAILTIETTTQGFLPPQMTSVQKNTIPSPAAGLNVYDTTLHKMAYFNGTSWVSPGAVSINIQTFFSNGTYTPSPNLIAAYIKLMGGGGAGGGTTAGTTTTLQAGGGGGSGGYVETLLQASQIGAGPITILIGAGGVGVNGGNGGNGGSSVFGGIVSANGGFGGDVGGPAAAFIPGGSGGDSSVTIPNISLQVIGQLGGYSGPNQTDATTLSYGFSGYGAGSFVAQSPGPLQWCPSLGAINDNGFGGNTYGVGGSGSIVSLTNATTSTGGNGFSGFVIITEYVSG